MKSSLPINPEDRFLLPSIPLPKIKRTLHVSSGPRFLSTVIESKWKPYFCFKGNTIHFCNKLFEKLGLMMLEDVQKCARAYRYNSSEIFLTTDHTADGILKRLSLFLCKQFASIKQLYMYLRCIYNIQDQAYEVFISRISRHLPALQHLTLEFNSSSILFINTKCLKRIGSELSHLTNLKSLSLTFFKMELLEYEGLKGLGSSISRHLVQLNNLELIFHSYSQLKDNSFEAIGFKQLSRLSKLQSLTFILNSYVLSITDEGLRTLSDNIDRLPIGLTKLKLSVHVALEVTNQGLQTLITNIAANLPYLKHLELSFACSNRITNEGLRAIGAEISGRNVEWQSLILHFPQCRYVEEDSKEELRQTLKFIQNLIVN